MNPSSITNVIAEGGIARCITATATVVSGYSGISILGVTDAAARDIRFLVRVVAKKRGLRLPQEAITIKLVFDVPFERTSELAFTALLAIAGTICPSRSLQHLFGDIDRVQHLRESDIRDELDEGLYDLFIGQPGVERSFDMHLELRLAGALRTEARDGCELSIPQTEHVSCIDVSECELHDVSADIGCDLRQ